MMTLVDTAAVAGLFADYVLFNSWFANPAIMGIKSNGMDVICILRSLAVANAFCNGRNANHNTASRETLFHGVLDMSLHRT